MDSGKRVKKFAQEALDSLGVAERAVYELSIVIATADRCSAGISILPDAKSAHRSIAEDMARLHKLIAEADGIIQYREWRAENPAFPQPKKESE